ncbi:bifunctional ADP-dependent NAD(P)H-hydrate dehydratase/NAD(P)H-hydrate epimerase [Piscirickettsia litoralis]|uniref:Bifunctional NAD(P)H-hydrate repair enzyme n=1 Tax=Piscirickettsia litoralis TaxID=1891921 RepID=A0ABX3A2T1_9GAMM|nr:bifunctional ADP-dependent NAD(P)H-hydrate dehydratase/NAD(P)H-hydrate epimerase [Piscirickettsia litoralis]ODN43181.1 bifunctional ADP-dependent (S)-NAD(P)H-hydrate dehydratase/NAD(P)H-hydrate epimerase [Piscirickettsia litoralis]
MEEVNLYTTEQVRALDQVAIHEFNINSFELMQKAGAAAFQVIQEYYPAKKQLLIFCGKGNNAGDGYIIASLAKQAGWEVLVQGLSHIDKLSGDAYKAADLAINAGVKISSLNCSEQVCSEKTVIIDALLGTGFQGKLQHDYLRAMRFINQLNAPCLSIDVPSGLNASLGICTQEAVRAEQTVTFIGNKQGLYTGDGPEYAGRVIYRSLDLAAKIYNKIQPDSYLLQQASTLLTKRRKNSHKGGYGETLVLAGGPGMLGAGLMAATAALRAGAGLVRLATLEDHARLVALYQPELMSYGLSENTSSDELLDLVSQADTLLVGPGLVDSACGLSIMDRVIRQAISLNKHLVLDAGALGWLAKNPLQYENWLLTPHPGEAARLLNCSSEKIQENRFMTIKKLQQKYQGCVVLKGCGSLIADEKNIYVCPYGNPGMASAGMGDVLAGIAAGLAFQLDSISLAAQYAVTQHGWTADRLLLQKGEAGLLATDIIQALRV